MLENLATPLATFKSWQSLVALFVALYIVYGACIGIYRLFLSPIAHFPGPKLAAATGWVEIWYDVFLGGQFTLKIEKWHHKYGR